jgi:carboxypeptidase Taq
MSYAELVRHHNKLAQLEHLEAIVGWDEATMMPDGGGEARTEAMATLRGMLHEQATQPALGALYAKAETEAVNLDPWQAANLREMKRGYVRATALPGDLVEASSRAESRSEQAWRKLRNDNDWASFLPLQAEVFARKREVAQALSEKLGLEPYDALLDGYEPGGRSADIAVLFARLGDVLPGLIQAVLDRQQSQAVVTPVGPFPVEEQRSLGLELMKCLGFDFRRGRLDVSHHPFCGGVPDDVRITTRFDENDFAKALMGVLHETGHAKYEQNLPRAYLGQPVGRARGMSTHESQSLLLEMQVCRSAEFARFAAPLIAAAFPAARARMPEAFTAQNLYLLSTRVRRGFIRVDADEVTYPCHVVLRFELEKALVEGKLEVKDVPEAWDAGMLRLLGLSTRDNFADGCMQDVHWPAGLIGYFPTYTLGALTAAQLFQAAEASVPDLRETIAKGDITPLDEFLRARLWGEGSRLGTAELVVHATGKPLGTEAFERHIARRYLDGA